LILAQVTRVAALPVDIPGLPGDLDAYPIYRFKVRDGVEADPKLLRLEVRAAGPPSSSAWQDTLATLEPGVREWLLKNAAGQTKRLADKLGSDTIKLLYRWCAAGIVTFEVEPPPHRGAPHGPLVRWRLTAPVRAHAEETARTSEALRHARDEEAAALAEELAKYPRTRLLRSVLEECRDAAYLEHAVAVARTLIVDSPQLASHESNSGPVPETCFTLRCLGRGSARDYNVDRDAIAAGGQAVVSYATHKATLARVVFKRPRFRDDDAVARMQREIEAGRRFGEHPHVMPVLDADAESRWFVMPVASGTAATYAHRLQTVDQLRELIVAICEALRRPHDLGWIHRDLKPENVLLFDGRWAIADWGLGRRPHGETSLPGRTRTGTGFGTVGFAAPELSLDAHEVGPPADIYSIGQLIGSILTTRRPQANIPLLPAPGPWRIVVERATRHDPSDRPQTTDELIKLIKELR
jgi:serine/threonine-protein kinase